MYPDLIPEMLRRQHLHFTSVGKNLLDEIVGRRKIIAEHGIVIACLNLFLGVVRRQGPEIFPLRAEDFQIHNLRRAVIIVDDSEAVAEIFLGVEIFGIGEGVVGFTHFLHPVESIYPQCVLRSIPRDHVPPLSEYLDKIGLHFGGVAVLSPEALVGHLQGAGIPHRLYYRGKVLLTGRNPLEKDAPFQAMALVDEVVHGEGVQEPCPDSAFLHVVSVLNIVAVSVPPVADDADVEYLLDGIPVVMESLQR